MNTKETDESILELAANAKQQLAAHDREVAAKALRDAAESVTNDPLTLDDFATWLHNRANAILASATPSGEEGSGE